MDSDVSEKKDLRPLRRSTRQSSVKVLNYEATPRGPLKRSKRLSETRAAVAAVNGSRNVENGSEDEGSPSKKSRRESGGTEVGGGDHDMDVQESVEDPEKYEDQEMDTEQDPEYRPHQPKAFQGGHGDMKLRPVVVLDEHCRLIPVDKEDDNRISIKRVQSSAKTPATFTSSTNKLKLSENLHDVSRSKISSMDENRTLKAKARSTVSSTDFTRINHNVPKLYPSSEMSYSVRQRVNNIPTHKETDQQKKRVVTAKAAVIRRPSADSSWGSVCFLSFLVLLVLLGSTALLVHRIVPLHQKTGEGLGRPSRPVRLETFSDLLSHLEAQFLSQRPDLWKRSKIHLENHLKTPHPTQPVSLILTAGRKAETTLLCLAKGVAAAFSSVLNASALYIDGASKSSQASDEVKLDIDRQLQAAFEGDKPVAVIHRFEELPPGSTLIFYRYCDHENAAYKQVFLLFTVLLPQDEIKGDLKDVEEIVHDYVKDRLESTSHQTAFNEMDADKYSGLWSRISHLILPVVSEEEVEQRGC
ncbi:torsin-1A-interacting protein 2-like [Aulostomus maculatus]